MAHEHAAKLQKGRKISSPEMELRGRTGEGEGGCCDDEIKHRRRDGRGENCRACVRAHRAAAFDWDYTLPTAGC